jgi:hypothetical protein
MFIDTEYLLKWLRQSSGDRFGWSGISSARACHDDLCVSAVLVTVRGALAAKSAQLVDTAGRTFAVWCGGGDSR